MFDIDTSEECTGTFWLWADLFYEKMCDDNEDPMSWEKNVYLQLREWNKCVMTVASTNKSHYHVYELRLHLQSNLCSSTKSFYFVQARTAEVWLYGTVGWEARQRRVSGEVHPSLSPTLHQSQPSACAEFLSLGCVPVKKQ